MHQFIASYIHGRRPHSEMKDTDPIGGVRLSRIRDALLALHKVLVESERASYEKTMGTIQSPNHFLQLLTTDPWFAWLHPLSLLVVTMDEALEEKDPLTESVVEALINQAGALLVASETGQGFSRHYHDALQENADVVMAHAEVAKLLRTK